MHLRIAPAIGVPLALAAGAMIGFASPANSQTGPSPQQFVSRSGSIKICIRGTLFDGMINLGCRPPHLIYSETTWKDLRQEEDAVSPMLCNPSPNRVTEATVGEGVTLLCTPVPATWAP